MSVERDIFESGRRVGVLETQAAAAEQTTLRDQFAMAALPALILADKDQDPDIWDRVDGKISITKTAYMFADKMLEMRVEVSQFIARKG